MARAEGRGSSGPWAEVCVVLCDDDAIARLNREYFGKDTPTDVISFAYTPPPGGARGGDLAVNLQRACAEGARRRGGPSRELALYIAHGCDHLTGATDDTPADRDRMLRRERRWLREAAPLGLLDSLVHFESKKAKP